MFRLNKPIIITGLCLLMLQSMSVGGYADDNAGFTEPDNSIRLELSTGYTTFRMNDAKEYYTESIEYYQRQNIPIREQRNFANNALIGLQGMYRVHRNVRVGIGSRYTSCPARSEYEDYSGSLTVSGTVRLLTLEGIGQFYPIDIGAIRPFIGVRGGLAYSYARLEDKFESDDYPSIIGDIVLSGDKLIYTVETFIGGTRNVGLFELQAQIGYRYAVIKDMDATLKYDGAIAESGPLAMKFDLSGFTMVITASLGL